MSGAIFLDRDGVINRKVDGDYVREWSQFEFLPGAVEALQHLAARGRGPLIVVTNQRGIARGLMSAAAVDEIHQRMRAALAAQGVRLAGMHVCPHEIGTCDCRKPGVKLFLDAAHLDPTLELERSAVVGDSLADLEAGRRLGAQSFAVSPDPAALVQAAREAGIEVSGAAPSLLNLARTGLLDRQPIAATAR
ncbi:MAG: D-glycero-D-manno-heptose 1,7-bisphosphate phosphatase [Chloroflexota bacterium]|jgi:histidinol-phosphate phosphatase family protein|nr:D-glycero-D-manno-heptose 1,7-bisphosphate phosphatase [Chloroflexota bacterium]